jgi:hypothetical protein
MNQEQQITHILGLLTHLSQIEKEDLLMATLVMAVSEMCASDMEYLAALDVLQNAFQIVIKNVKDATIKQSVLN